MIYKRVYWFGLLDQHHIEIEMPNGSKSYQIFDILHLTANPDLSLLTILTAINSGAVRCGRNEDFCWVSDEDGYIAFLYRNRPFEWTTEDGEQIDYWPINSQDGECLYKLGPYINKEGIIAIEEVFSALNIKYC